MSHLNRPPKPQFAYAVYHGSVLLPSTLRRTRRECVIFYGLAYGKSPAIIRKVVIAPVLK